MIALVLLTYAVPLDEVLRHVAEHRAYLQTLHEGGTLLASGPFVPRTGGALLLRTTSREAVDRIIEDDPFHKREIARYEVREWAPTLGADALEAMSTRAKGRVP
jgi:uncharacterized protein YciI